MAVLLESLKPELKNLSGLKNAVLIDIYGEFTGNHKDYKSLAILEYAKAENAEVIVDISSGNQALSLNEVVKKLTYNPPEIVHIIPEDSPYELELNLKETFSKVKKWPRNKFLSKDKLRS